MISIIIPTFNESEQIANTVRNVIDTAAEEVIEIIIVDGGSTDNTKAIVEGMGIKIILSERKGRAAQMNSGADIARGEILYFLHADSVTSAGFTTHILTASACGFIAGCFRLAFDHKHWFLKANAWFTRFNVNAIRFGDQSLFVRKDIFRRIGGFNEELLMMEDQEIIHRIKACGKFKVMPYTIVTSARKYLDNGIFRMQGIFFRIWGLYYLGYSQQKLLTLYRKLIYRSKL